MNRPGNPWRILDLEPQATPDEIRTRFVELCKRHPPDRDAAAFERIRDAYHAVRDPRRRAVQRVLGPPPIDGIEDLLELLNQAARKPAGPERWLAAIKDGQD